MNANVQVAAHSEISAPPAGGEFDYLLDRITAAEAYADPFEHLVTENFLSPEHLAEITSCADVKRPVYKDAAEMIGDLLGSGWEVQKFPGCVTSVDEYLAYLRTKKIKRNLAERFNGDILEGYGMTLRLMRPQSSILQRLQQFLTSPALEATLRQKFGITQRTSIDTGVQKYLTGYEISPHPDTRKKALTYMLNINSSPASEDIPIHTYLLEFTKQRRYIYELWEGNPQMDRCWVPWDWCEVRKQTNLKVLEAMIHREGVEATIERFAPLPGVDGRGNTVHRFTDVASFRPTAVMVGGGDVIRTDAAVVAADQLEIPTRERRRLSQRIRSRLYSARYVKRGPGPWLPANGWAGDVPVAYASVGVHELPDTPRVRSALSTIRSAWIRTHRAEKFLTSVGVPAERCTVAPDAVFALPHFVDPAEVRATGQRILREVTGNSDPALVLHAAPFSNWTAKELVSLMEQLDGIPIVVLALGHYCGEHTFLREAASAAGRPFVDDLETDEVTAVLAGAGAILSTSMHAAIVGAAFGTPVLATDIEKINSALSACPVPPEVFPASKLDMAKEVRRTIGSEMPPADQANAVAAQAAMRAQLLALGLV